MCGIAGALGSTRDVALPLVEVMLDNLLHRGPDQHGLWASATPGAVFGHRRLSIIDLSEAGRQPMIDEASGVALTYNGEFYNYLEIKKILTESGHSFKSGSDTEVILKAYLEWGAACLEKMRGMFAMAIWDPRSSETLLVRDRLGIKPVYYYSKDGLFLFASEVRALLATGAMPKRLNRSAVAAYLWQGFVPGPDTMVQDIHRLDPGCYLRINAQGKVLERQSYWQLPAAGSQLSTEEALHNCHNELQRAASEHLVSDVPLGVFLSGGVDSSAMAALAQRAVNRPVTTYNIRFDEQEYDESGYAAHVADKLQTDHHELTLTEGVFHDQLEDALAALDQPTFDAINTYFVSRAVREAGLTVALAGTGGDELLGGYSSFKELPTAQKLTGLMRYLPSPLRRGVGHACLAMISRNAGEVRPQVRWGKIQDMLDARGDLLGLYQVSYALFSREFQASLTLGEHDLQFGCQPGRAERLRAELNQDADVLAAVSRLELANFLGERLLPDTDMASMAVSLEVRVPLLDHQFVESLLQLSTAQRFEPVGRKGFLRSAMAKELPPETFDRPKAGFELPLQKWCRAGLAEQMDATLRDMNLAHSIGLSGEAVSRLWRAFSKDAPGLYWSRVWSIFVLMNWCRQHGLSV